ncbi:DNA polymerase beta superfamily protein [Lysinibacillus xylanilyticus]|uniref:nucleotidyltransferase domain-containing protein n=1 Tax=Lysinibacillus xylanilyticus TaxID=582475 RepID=UPI00382E96E7
MEIKNLIPNEPSWLGTRTILLGRGGSHAYGTATKNSDFDFKGVCVPPLEYFLGLQSFDGYDKKGGKNFKNQAGDIDVTIIHINKFVRDAMAGVPNNLELLFLDESDYIHVSVHGRELINMRKQFLSKQIMKKFSGYAKSQAQKMKELKSTRNELLSKFGYDTKFYMHTVRLLEMAIEILNHGTLTVKRSNHAHLLSLREGIHTLDEALDNIEILEQHLKVAYDNSILPERPDFELISRWLVDFNIRVANSYIAS